MKASFALLAVLLVGVSWAPSAYGKHGADDPGSPASPASPASPKSPASPAAPKPAAPGLCPKGAYKCGGKCYRPRFVKSVKCAKRVFSFICKAGHLKCGPTCCPTPPAGAKAYCKVYPSKKTECEIECKEGWRKCKKVKKCCKKPCRC